MEGRDYGKEGRKVKEGDGRKEDGREGLREGRKEGDGR
jgi:hypothetical protein